MFFFTFLLRYSLSTILHKFQAHSKKWAEDLNKHLSKENIQITNRHMERYSISLVIREIQIKTTMRYHLIPVRMAIIKKSTNDKCWKDIEKREPFYTVGGNVN